MDTLFDAAPLVCSDEDLFLEWYEEDILGPTVSSGNAAVGPFKERGEQPDQFFASLLQVLNESVTEIGQVDLTSLTKRVRLDALKNLKTLETRVSALRSSILAAVERLGDWEDQGARTLPEFDRRIGGSTLSQARTAVQRAKVLDEELPRFKQAFLNGEITPEHVDILRSVTKEPEAKQLLADPIRGEEHLLEVAKSMDADKFRRKAKAWGVKNTPKVAEREHAQQLRQETLTLVSDDSGWRIHGWMTPLNGEILNQSLTALMGVPSESDPRMPNERRAGALVELASAHLDGGTSRTASRVRPHLSIHVPVETIVGAHLAAKKLEGVDSDLADGTTAQGQSDLGQVAPDADGVSTCSADAQFISRYLKDSGTSGEFNHRICPVHGVEGECLTEVKKVREMVGTAISEIQTRFNPDLFTGLEPATLDDGTPLVPSQLDTLLCDSFVRRIVLGPDSQPLDVGRANRSCGSHQVRAVIARDRTCRFPGCEHTITASQVHHAHHWESGGNSDIDNLVMLCWYHHQELHRRNIDVHHHARGWVFVDRSGIVGVTLHDTDSRVSAKPDPKLKSSPLKQPPRSKSEHGNEPESGPSYEPESEFGSQMHGIGANR